MIWLWRMLITMVLLSAIPYGSNRPWSWSVAGVAFAAITLGWYWQRILGHTRTYWHPALWAPAIGFATVVIWVLIQSRWPVSTAVAHPIWQLAGHALGTPLTGRISASPQAADVALIRLLSAATVFWLSLQLMRHRERAGRSVHWLALGVGGVALYGLVNFIAGNEYLVGFRRVDYNSDVTGTFVNRNNFATFAGLGIILLTGQFIDTYRRRWRDIDPTLSWIGSRQAALAGWPTVYLTTGLVVLMALLQSHSRMGLAATLVGIGTLLLLSRVAGLMRGITPLVMVAVLMLGGLWASGQTMINRIADGNDSSRPELLALTERAIASAPLTGSGYGSFASVFPMYRDLTLPDPVSFEMAHSSYLELAMDVGIPAAIVLVGAIAWLGAITLTGVWRRGRDRMLPAMAASATVLVAVHSTLDFSLQIPGVEYMFAAILGIGVAQSFSSANPTEHAEAPAAISEGGYCGDPA